MPAMTGQKASIETETFAHETAIDRTHVARRGWLAARRRSTRTHVAPVRALARNHGRCPPHTTAHGAADPDHDVSRCIDRTDRYLDRQSRPRPHRPRTA